MEELYSPEGYKKLSKEAKEEICNGCGAGNAKFDFVPDSIYGLYIGEVCNIHDYMYHVGVTLADKEEADRVMRNNLIRLINNKGGILKTLRRWRAGTYYVAVDKYGGPAFWEGKNV
jgi:hypothetical protein